MDNEGSAKELDRLASEVNKAKKAADAKAAKAQCVSHVCIDAALCQRTLLCRGWPGLELSD